MPDNKHRVAGVYLVGKDSMYACHCDPSEVFKAALVTNCPAFAIVHNHPSGAVEPSRDDAALTQRIRRSADILGLDFLDSVIIGDGRYFSFYERDLMERQQADSWRT